MLATPRELIVMVGPVSADKTTQALIAAKTYALTGRVIIARPSKSLRPLIGESLGTLVTKSGLTHPCIEIEATRDLVDLPDAEVYIIDEPSLFPGEMIEAVVFDCVEELRKKALVIVVGLGATSEMTPFGKSMGLLMQTADEIVVLKGLCNWCGRHKTATRSVFMDPNGVKDGDVKVGATETYRPACPDCYNRVMQLTTRQRFLSLCPHLSVPVGE